MKMKRTDKKRHVATNEAISDVTSVAASRMTISQTQL